MNEANLVEIPMPVKPSSNEEEHFIQQEFESRKRLAQVIAARLAREEQTRLRELHWMRCPKDGSELKEASLRGVKVDICSLCGGMWLDAGELEALVEGGETGILSRFHKLFRG